MESPMRTVLILATAMATAVGAASTMANLSYAQGAPQTVALTKVDVVKVSSGYRASKVIGSSVVNEANDTVGKIDDIIISSDGKAPFAVLSVGGFLGVGNKYVVLPYEQLRTTGDKVMLPGATKDALKALPEFKYASR
jgi:sporulation protein YlmC with PRC-barrel domain